MVVAAAVVFVPHMRPAVMVRASAVGVTHAMMMAVLGVVGLVGPVPDTVLSAAVTVVHSGMVNPFAAITTVVMAPVVLRATVMAAALATVTAVAP